MKYIKAKIKIDGEEGWCLPTSKDSPEGAIAPLHHCDEHGNLQFPDCFDGNSIAHVFEDGVVRKFGEAVGNIDELLEAI